MNPARIAATMTRVVSQLRHDPRTLLLLFVLPSFLLILLRYVFDGNIAAFHAIAPTMLGIFPMVMMFLITSIATLRERRSGTLDRLMTMPVSKIDFIFGYALAFFFVSFLQAVITSIVLLGFLDVPMAGGAIATVVGAIFAALLGTALGLFSSAFASTEFQAVQFMPAFILPQLLVCGLFVAKDQMAQPLQRFADIMPMTYSVDAMKQVAINANWTFTHTKDLLVVTGFTIIALIAAAITIRRQEKA